LRKTLYPYNPDPPLSVEALQLRLIWLQLTAEAVSPVGTEGAMVSAAGVLVAVRVGVLVKVAVDVGVLVGVKVLVAFFPPLAAFAGEIGKDRLITGTASSNRTTVLLRRMKTPSQNSKHLV
jgi:hypothetical protein